MAGAEADAKTPCRELRKVNDCWNCFLTYIADNRIPHNEYQVDRLRIVYTQIFMEDSSFNESRPCYVFDELIKRLKRYKKIKIDDNRRLIGNIQFERKTISDYIKDREEDRATTAQKTQGLLHCPWCDTFYKEDDKSKRNHRQSKNHQLMTVLYFFRQNRCVLRQSKNGVKITSEHDRVDSENDMYKETYSTQPVNMKITIENISETDVFLKRCQFMTTRDQFEIVRRNDGTTIRPNEKIEITVQCKPRHLSNYRNVLGFYFESPNNETFHIFRSICVQCKSALIDELKPIAPYKKPKRTRRRSKQIKTVDGMQLPEMRSDGLRMSRLNSYRVQKDVRSKVSSRDADGSLVNELSKDLSIKSYSSKFSKLLQVEEIQMEIDIERYRMEAATMTRDADRRFLRLKVPGLAENRPSVLKGDHLFATPAGNQTRTRYKGYVHRVELEEVVLGFSRGFVRDFIPNMKFEIDFTFNRLPIRLQHLAVNKVMRNELSPTLFPDERTAASRRNLHENPHRMVLFDRDLETNVEQCEAVKHITEGVSRPAPYLVFGPPGTGKTVTIVEAIRQVYKNVHTSKILACAPSNSAADLIATRILKKGTVAKSTILRMNAYSRNISTIDPYLKDDARCCNIKDGDNYFPAKEDIERYRIVVTTLCTAGRLARAEFSRDHFTHIFIDEAGHAQEPEAIIPIFNLLNPDNPDGGQLVLAGDPKQLGPVLRSPYAVKYGLATSLLERLMSSNPLYTRKKEGEHYNSRVMTKLLKNYRSHPDILKLPNELFYDDELQACANEMRNTMCDWEELPKKNFPLIFHGVDGNDERESNSPSFFNTAEAATVVNYVNLLMTKKRGKKLKQEEIGVISPYRKQVQKIQQALKKHNYNKIKVGSVEEFQGQERLVIIVSTVRSNREDYLKMDREYQLGFLDNPKRFNVAITRAKALLIVVGNPVVLSKDENWKRLIDFCKTKGGTIGVLCDVDDDNQNLLDSFNRINLTDKALEAEEAMDVSQVAQQNDPAWRAEL